VTYLSPEVMVFMIYGFLILISPVKERLFISYEVGTSSPLIAANVLFTLRGYLNLET
jgi:hypothetical protein